MDKMKQWEEKYNSEMEDISRIQIAHFRAQKMFRAIERNDIHEFNRLYKLDAVLDYEKLKERVNRILLYDVNKKRKGMFVRIINPKTGKYRKGWYKLSKSRK